MIMGIIKMNPKGSNVYKNKTPFNSATPLGSYVLTKNFFYKHDNPSDCIDNMLNQLKEAVK